MKSILSSVRSIAIAAVLLMAGMLSSCSHRGELLETIPSDAIFVGTLDLKELCSEAGIKFTADGLEVSSALDSRVRGDVRDYLRLLSTLDREGTVDVTAVMLAADSKGETFATFSINDFSRFKTAAGDLVKWEDDSEGYHIAKCGMSLTLVASDHQGWLTAGSAPVRSVKALLEGAKKESVAKLEGVTQALKGDAPVIIASSQGLMALNGFMDRQSKTPVHERTWNILSLLPGADNSLVAQWSEITSTGESVKPSGMKDINPALLAYIPADFPMVYAAGITEGFDWTAAERIITTMGGFQGSAFMSVAAPYLQSIDGTVLLAVKPRVEAGQEDFTMGMEPDEWDYLALVKMPREKISSLMSMIRTMAFTAGMSPQVDSRTGIMSFPQYGGRMYIGEVDGCLGIATIPFDNTRNNPLAPTFVNKQMALSATASLEAFLPGTSASGDVNLTASMAAGKGEAKIKISGSDRPVMEYLLSLLLQ